MPSRILITVLCILLTFTRASAQNPAVDKIFAPWASEDSPGCAVAVIHNGKIVHERGYGMADLENGIPIRPTTVFNIASVSKQFTVFLILLLVQAGLLSLDDDVRTHVPELPDFGKKITIRHLISHTSGLREDWSMLTLAGWRSEDVITRDDVFSLIRRQKELNFNPGDDYSYCNTGYHLLAQIVQKTSGKSLREYGQEKLFEPLGMKQTIFQDDHRMIIKGRAQSYAPKKGGGFERVLYGAGRAGPGNLHTTILDLAKWDQNFYEPKVGGEKVVAEQLRKSKLNSGKEIDYAGGLRHGTYRGLPIVEHSGVIAGYRSVLLRFPEEKFSVILLANVSSFKPAFMARRIADIYLGPKLKPIKDGVDAPAALLEAFAGEYRFASGQLLAFTADGNKLYLKTDTAKVRLLGTSERDFGDNEAGIRYSFTVADGKAPTTVIVKSIGLDQVGERVVRPKLTAAELTEFAGEFRSEELDVVFTIRLQDGKLHLRHRKGDLTLDAMGNDEFSAAPTSLFSSLRYVRSEGKQIVGFNVSTPRARHLRFERVAIKSDR